MKLKVQPSLFRGEIPDLWYKDAIMYEVDVESFYDSDGDGVGDFQGLLRRLDYLSALGVTCIWLTPFFSTPNRDNGYDVSNFYDVDSRLGTLGDFVEFMHLARERGIRVLADLVVNHTSNEHPWFQASRKDKNSPYRDYYIWADERPPGHDQGIIFPGEEESTWTYDEVAGQWYFHRFYSFQPDLNIANPAVRDEIRKMVGFWLELGVSGFRVDAVPYFVEQTSIDQELRELRDFLSWRQGDAILLGEANIGMEDVLDYFGDGTKMHMLFNFGLTAHMMAAFALASPKPLLDFFPTVPPLPKTGQWANFLRNHDECNLSLLNDDLRERVAEILSRGEDAKIYGRGVRRRLAPMLEGDVVRIKLANSLMFSMPGTPVIWYGEEIGMGDDLSLKGRDPVRTPMQWSDGKNGGFSLADAGQLIRPVLDEGAYAYQRVNVAEQRRKPDSLLSWMQALIRTRRECPEIGRGKFRLLPVAEPSVLAHRYDWSGGAVLILHNFASKPVVVQLNECQEADEHLIDLFGEERYRAVSCEEPLELGPYGYRWLRVNGSSSHPY